MLDPAVTKKYSFGNYQCRVFEKPLIPKSDEVMAISTIVTEPLSMLTEYRKKLAVNINCIKVAHSSGGSR